MGRIRMAFYPWFIHKLKGNDDEIKEPYIQLS